MRIKVLGSGGCVSLPLPTCQCDICMEAREKGAPYSRGGPSIFIEDINTLIDTPEDIVQLINRENIKAVDNILYSHWDPDHTLGLRVIEALKLRWLEKLVDGKDPDKKVNIIAIDEVYAPCDVKPFPQDEDLYGADVLLIGNTIPDQPLKDGYIVPENNPLWDELFSIDEVLEIKNKYKISKTIVTHLEEDWGKSYDDYRKLEEEKYKKENLSFAYDGMIIEL